MMDSGLVAELKRIAGADSVSVERYQIDRFAGDALGTYRAFGAGQRLLARPRAVVQPQSTAEVAAVLRFANHHKIPVVPYGGGTGVMGAAAPSDGCIILNLRRIDGILSVSREDMAATFQAGVILEHAARAMEGDGLTLGHDPWSRPIATVGGAISTNGVGYTAAKHGSMGEQVLGLEVVMANGEVVRTKSVPKAAHGPSLNHLFIGSEGTLGVITQATLRAFPLPETRVLRSLVFPDFESGFRAVAELYRQDVHPTMVDYGDELWTGEPSENTEATLYLAFEGFGENVAALDLKARQISHGLGGRDGDQKEVEQFWATRHESGERYRREVLDSADPGKARRRSTAYRMDYLHVALPASQVLEYRRRCQTILAARRVMVREWSLWARAEFLSFVIVEEDDQGDETSLSMAETVDQVLTLAQEMGGTMEYCHGVGVKLAHLVEAELGSGVSVARAIKLALDPNNILNPDKLTGQ